jgi:hypothetical protein
MAVREGARPILVLVPTAKRHEALFTQTLGCARGAGGRRRLTAKQARSHMHERGRVSTTGVGDDVVCSSALAVCTHCVECGHVGLHPEFYQHVSTRRWRRAILLLVAATAFIGCRLLGVENGPSDVVIVSISLVAWYIIRDFGYRALGVCPDCNCAQAL